MVELTERWSLTGSESLLSIWGKKLKNFRLVSKAILLLFLRLLLVVAGLGFVCAAAWVIALPLGLFTIGVSLLVLEWVVKR